jgi:hypothetical protein
MTLKEGHRQRVFENRVLRERSGSKKGMVRWE